MTAEQGPPRPLRDRCRVQPVSLDALRSRLDDRPGLHRDCVPEDMHREEFRRRYALEQQIAEVRASATAEVREAWASHATATQQRDDARALALGLLRVLDAAADALDVGVHPARVAEDLRHTVQPHYLDMVQGGATIGRRAPDPVPDETLRVIALLVDRLGGSVVITGAERVALMDRVVTVSEPRLDGSVTLRTRGAGA